MAPRPHPHIAIPPGAAPPTNPSPQPTHDWNFLVTPPDPDPLNLWNEEHRHSVYSPITPSSSRPHILYPEEELNGRPPSRAASVQEAGSPRYAFPEPQPFQSPLHAPSLRPSSSFQHLGHRSSRSESALIARQSVARGESRPPSYVSTESSPELSATVLSDELSSLTIDSEEGLRRFQAGDLPDQDEEWYRLVPPEAREVLDKAEVQRQSVLFEIIKSERDYVRDLELVRDVFIDPLVNTSPVPQSRLKGFVSEVFYNLDDILVHHRRMLDALFARQREQHPLLQSLADVVLDTGLAFRTPYETYIKHYPLAVAYHRKELRRNSKYQYFLQQCSQDPRIRKRDIITFLSRPVTRLPRLALLLETAKKCTAADHPDQETLPLILNIMNDFIKSTQPGIEAAESKVKFWALCESLVYQKGEIIDMDLYDESRTLLHSGQLARRYSSRTEVKYTWIDLHVALLDNYLLLLRPELRSNGTTTRNSVISRPIPLEYLRLSLFDAPPENRREKAHSSIEQSRLFDSFRSRYRQMFPFTIYHASATLIRRYTLYAVSEKERERWRKALVDAIGVRKVRQDANKLFAPQTISEGFFRASSNAIASRAPGKITAATLLLSGGKSFVVVGCPSGIYVAARGDYEFKRVLKKAKVAYLHALQEFKKIIVHSQDGVESYSLDLMARVVLGTSRPQDLDASLERLSELNVAVIFAKAVKVMNRTMVLYACKNFMQVTLHAMEALPANEGNLTPRRTSNAGPLSFRSFGEPSWIPKDSHDVVALHKTIGVCAERGIHILDPTNLSNATPNATIIPTFSEQTEPMQMLKQRCSSAKPLGVLKVERDELLVIFDELGCYIDRHGKPRRSSGYLRWETKATAYAHRGEHVLLFSPEFIEVRAVATGKLLQVIEGQDIRLVHASERAVLVAMRKEEDKSDKLVELVETADLTAARQQQASAVPASVWDEWDM